MRDAALFLVLGAALVLFPSAPPALAGGTPKGQRVGGPCDYASYPGTARILSVTPAAPAEAQPGQPYPGLRVRYAYTPSGDVSASGARDVEGPKTLTMANGWDPGPKFVEKYGLTPGRILPCELLVIRSGTCTPVLYRLGGVDTADYLDLPR